MKPLRLLVIFFLLIHYSYLPAQDQNPLEATNFYKNNEFIDKNINTKSIKFDKLLVIYDSSLIELDNDLLKPEKNYFRFKCETEYISIQDTKKTFGKNALTTNKNILDILVKKNAGLMLLLNKRDNNFLEGYLYEGSYGNCIEYREFKLNEKQNNIKYLTGTFNRLITFYESKFNGDKPILFIKSSLNLKDLLTMSRFSRYAIYIHYLLNNSQNVILLIDDAVKENFVYCTKSIANNMIYLSKPNNENKIIKITYLIYGVLNTLEPEKSNSLKSIYDDIAKKLSDAYEIDIAPVKQEDIYIFLDNLPYSYYEDVFRNSIRYYVFPFDQNNKTQLVSLLNERNFNEYFKTNNNKIIKFDKFDLELNKLDYLKEEIERKRLKADFSGYMDFSPIFKSNNFTQNQKNQISLIKNDMIENNIDILTRDGGLYFDGFLNFGLESTDAITRMFGIFNDYYKKNNYNLKGREILIRRYFDAIDRFDLSEEGIRPSTEERAKQLEIICSYMNDKDDLIAFVSRSKKIENYKFSGVSANATKIELDVEQQNQIQLEKELKAYKPLLIKYLEFANEKDVCFPYKLNNQNVSNALVDELMGIMRKKWENEGLLSNGSIYFSIFCSKLKLGRTVIDGTGNEKIEIKNAVKDQLQILSGYIGSFKEANLFSNDREDIFSSLLNTINQIVANDKTQHELYMDFSKSILVPGIISKFTHYKFTNLLNNYIKNISENFYGNDDIKTCKYILDYLDSSKGFKDNRRERLTLITYIDKMVFKNKSENSEIVTPESLKFNLVLTREKVESELKLNLGRNFKAYSLLKNVAHNDNEIAYLYYSYSKDEKSLKLFLAKYALNNGMSTIIKEFDGNILLDSERKEKSSSTHLSSLDDSKFAFFKDSFYIVYNEQLFHFEHKTGKGKIANLEGFENQNQNIIMIRGINNKLFIFKGGKNNNEKIENIFGYYDVESKTFKYVLRNDESGGNGLINSNNFEVFSVYMYNEDFYVSLNSKVTGTQNASSKVCRLDLLKGEHSVVCSLNHERANLYFIDNKIVYLNYDNYYVKDLKFKKEFAEQPKGWVDSQNCIPVKNGIIFTKNFNDSSMLYFFDFESKETQINFNGYLSINYNALNFYSNEGMILIDGNENVLLFPNLKEN